MSWTTDENGDMVYTGEDNGDTQTVYTDDGIYYTESPDSNIILTGDAVQIGSNWYFPKDDGTYSVNGGSSTLSADAVQRLQNGDTTVDPLGGGTVTGGTANSEPVAKGLLDRLTGAAGRAITDRYTNKTTGAVDWGNVVKDASAAYALTLNNKPNKAGYNIPVPELRMTRQQVMPNDPNRRPGSGGLNYFTDPKYAKLGDAPAQSAADYADTQQAAGIRAAYTPAVAKVNPYEGTGKATDLAAFKTAATNPVTTPTPATTEKALAVPEAQLTGGLHMATGGLASFAQGGNNYLQGATDGMADKLNTSIDDTQAAKLSHGEFVIPADVVSHLGNGNSEAGAHKLYDMMARIRKARTGNPEQGKRINPDKFMPGGSVGYSGGGAIAFAGLDGSVVPTPAASTSSSDVLSDWAGPLVSGALAKGFAASNAPYQAYQGPLTAGTSDLQNQAFAGASDIAKTGYAPTSFTTGTFDTSAANKYMNPYLSASLNPQLQELQRQSQISNMANAGKLTQAGAYGGSRQAILQGEENRNLLDKSQDLINTGYRDAYDKAMGQFNADQNRGLTAQQASESSRQFGANSALAANKNLADLGATERGITSEGITADKKQFEEQRDNPLSMAQYQLSLMSKLPITTRNTDNNTSDYTQFLGKLGDIDTQLKRLGVTP
jgi:hypothetical protein